MMVLAKKKGVVVTTGAILKRDIVSTSILLPHRCFSAVYYCEVFVA